ncbi:transcription factor [Rhodotorula toruloides]|uniref:Transcription factor n=1 Tax=Rhodotorula toruloides TaxID=5286 RepID=A0A511KHG5_RHOTO|nr:transcription factor [Rhodotorula toruloides]
MATVPVSSPDKARSSFVVKLHQLLCAEQHPEYLHWINSDTFAITSVEPHARHALSPQWDFRSLSSFIRQLSYYSFKRLSDRRRSAERRSSAPSFIVFTHPSGNFVRDDQAKAALIQRKLRARKPAQKRKNSTASSAGTGQEQDYGDRSPSPNDGNFELYEHEDEVKPNVNAMQLGLQQYQLPAWDALEAQGRTIHSSPRTIPGAAHVASVPPHMHVAYGPLKEQASPYDTGYPSPISAPSSNMFFPAQGRPHGYYPSAPPPDQAYYYPQPSTSMPDTSTYGAYSSSNELPPIRTVTSGLVVPPSPPPEPGYLHHPVPQSRPPQDDEERTPSPLASHAAFQPQLAPIEQPQPRLMYEASPMGHGPASMPPPPQPHAVDPVYYPSAFSRQPLYHHAYPQPHAVDARHYAPHDFAPPPKAYYQHAPEGEPPSDYPPSGGPGAPPVVSHA